MAGNDGMSAAQETSSSKRLSRRDFLKMAGAAGAGIGVAGGLGGLLAACDPGDETTTTADATSSTAAGAAGAPSADETTTSASTSAEMGGEIKCCYVVPLTAVSLLPRLHQASYTWMVCRLQGRMRSSAQ